MTQSVCPACGNNSWETRHELRNKYTIQQCQSCQMLRSLGTPSHGTGDDEFGALDLDTYFKSMKKLREESAAQLLDQIEIHQSVGRILDIGCSFGWFLDVARARGWETYGIEPSDLACNHVTERSDHKILHGVYPETNFKDIRFDVIVMTDVLEHLPEPVTILNQLSSALAPDGIIALRVPSRDGMIYKTASTLASTRISKIDSSLWRMWQLDFPYPHLWYFNPETLSAVVKKAGYEILHVQTEPVIKMGGISTRVHYASNGKTSLLKNWATTSGLAVCALAGQLFKMDDECFVIGRPEERAYKV